MKKIIFLFFLFIISMNSFSQVAQQWVQRFNGPGNGIDNAVAIVLDRFGNIYVTGTSFGITSGFDYTTIKYNPSGVQQWASFYNGPANDSDMAADIAIDSSGNLFVTGKSEGSISNFDYATVKYNNLGVQQWVARYNGSANNFDYAVAIGADASGNSFVTGTVESTGGSLTDFATIKYNSAGVQQWAIVHNLPFSDYASDIAIDGLGNPCITGTVQQGQGYYDFNTIKYNSAGVQLWETTRFTGGQSEVPSSIVVDASGNFCVTGMWNPGLSSDQVLTVKYNSAGVSEWEKFYSGGRFEESRTALFDDSGNVFIATFSHNSGPGHNIVSIKYDQYGAQQWVNNYNGPGNGGDAAYSAASDHSGNFYVTGPSWSGTSYDYVTIKYNLSGVQQWIMYYSVSPGIDDNSYSVKVDNYGNVYVAGQSGSDFATIRYSQFIPSVPVLYSPVYNAINQPVNMNLVWMKSTSAVSYRVQLATDSLFTNLVVNDSTVTDSIKAVTGLNYVSNYWWRVNAKNSMGVSVYSSVWKFRTMDPLSINPLTSEIPDKFSLLQNYPNPFNPTTHIGFKISDFGLVKIYIYNSLGTEVETIINQNLQPGTYEVEWNGSNYSSGIYYYKLVVGAYIETKKMVLIK